MRDAWRIAAVMLRATFVLLAALMGPLAHADYMGGLWAPGTNPPGSHTKSIRLAPSGAALRPELASNLYVLTEVPQFPAYHEWNGVFALNSLADYGDHTALYVKTHRKGKGPAFGAVVELTDYGGDGPAWALEVDAMVSGHHRGPKTGIGIVIGRSRAFTFRDPNDTATARLDYGLHLLPYYYDAGFVDVDYGIRIGVHCAKSCLSILGGESISFTDDPAVPVQRFDPPTGYVGYWKERLCVWCVHSITGQIEMMRQF